MTEVAASGTSGGSSLSGETNGQALRTYCRTRASSEYVIGKFGSIPSRTMYLATERCTSMGSWDKARAKSRSPANQSASANRSDGSSFRFCDAAGADATRCARAKHCWRSEASLMPAPLRPPLRLLALGIGAGRCERHADAARAHAAKRAAETNLT